MKIPFFRPSIGEREIEAVTSCLRSGWLTTGQVTRDFESEFAAAVGAKHAVALNSCTAALHLALDAIGLQRGDLVLVPTMTFAATAEVVRYFDATPVFIDCRPDTLCIDPAVVESTLEALDAGRAVAGLQPPYGKVRAIIPMHYAGQIAEVEAISRIAKARDLAVIEDAAHSFPAAYRDDSGEWRSVGASADITCFSFYANKCITTGEGGMAVTNSAEYADRMRLMSLHGMSRDAWQRYTAAGSWYYEVVAPGFKYNMTDIASALGRVQLARADELLRARSEIARDYLELLAGIPGLQLPRARADRRHAWHLFPIQLDVKVWRQGRDAVIEQLKERGIGTSVHWQPLHMQPYYRELFGYQPEQFPVACSLWPKLISLPIYPGLTRPELEFVAETLRALCG